MFIRLYKIKNRSNYLSLLTQNTKYFEGQLRSYHRHRRLVCVTRKGNEIYSTMSNFGMEKGVYVGWGRRRDEYSGLHYLLKNAITNN